MWAAIRHRRAQAVGLALLSALITACAAFAPVYERSLEEALLRDGLLHNGSGATALTLVSVSANGATPDPAQVRALFPPSLATVYDSGQGLWTGRVVVPGRSGSSTVVVRAPQETCRALRIVSGACPTQAGQILVSADEARIQGWRAGTRLSVPEAVPAVAEPVPLPTFTVVGTYDQLDDPDHWFGARLTGRAGRTSGGLADTPLMDDWVTTEATFTRAWTLSRFEVDHLLDRRAVTLASLATIPPAVAAAAGKGLVELPTVTVSTRTTSLVAEVAEGQRQARLIVPLVMGQLALLAVVVFALVASAAVEQRRPEIALVRLRGRGGRQAAARVLAELGVVVALGVPVGVAVAVGLDAVARHTWLTPGVGFEVPPVTALWALAGLAVALLAVVLVTRPVVREPISTLLRRIPPRRRGWAVGVADALVVGIAVAGVASVVSGNVSGPLVLATPTLLALAVGLVLAHVVVPLAAAAGHRLLGRGRVVPGLAATQLARRPAVRHVITIVTVATALTVFAADAVAVGAANRRDRALVETGAPVVLDTDAQAAAPLLDAVRRADPTGSRATPVVVVPQGDASAMSTLAVRPAGFLAVGQLPRDRSAFDVGLVGRPAPPEGTVTGSQVSVTLSDLDLRAAPGPLDDPGADLSKTGLEITLTLARPGTAGYTVSLGSVPVASRGPVTLRQSIDCTQTCRVTGFSFGTSLGSTASVSGRLTVGEIRSTSGPAAVLGPVTSWLSPGDPQTLRQQNQEFVAVTGSPDPSHLVIEVSAQRAVVSVPSQASGGAVPALVLGELPAGGGGTTFQAAGLDGLTTTMSRVAAVPYLPGGGTREALVDLDRLVARSGAISPLGTAQVWCADDAVAATVRTRLSEKGIAVTEERRSSDALAQFDSSASAWGLQLALVVGAVALAMAALVLVLVASASWRGRLRDDAGLRLVGVPSRVLAGAARVEQLAVVLVSVVVGAVCGVVGASLALPMVPFFTTPSSVLPVDTRPALVPVVASALAALALLVVVGALIAARTARATTLERVREPL